MNETTMYDILESCLLELENGAQIDSLLAHYPAYANDLRPILIAASEAQKMSAPEPSREASTRGRARLMQRVSELREAQSSKPHKRVIPFFQRIAIAFAVAAIFISSGTGLVSASSSALPGQNLYPVKRRWENVRLFFAFNAVDRKLLEGELENEREHEANELLSEGEEHGVEFSGVLTTVNGTIYVSTLPVIFPDNLQIPADGTVIKAEGRTTDKGYVEITEFKISEEANPSSNTGGDLNEDSHDENDNNSKDNHDEVISTPSFTAPESSETKISSDDSLKTATSSEPEKKEGDDADSDNEKNEEEDSSSD